MEVNPNNRRHFIAKLTGDFTNRLVIPAEFARKKNGKSRWYCKLKSVHCKKPLMSKISEHQGKYYLSRGWTEFVKLNKLERGMDLVFFLVPPCTFEVIISCPNITLETESEAEIESETEIESESEMETDSDTEETKNENQSEAQAKIKLYVKTISGRILILEVKPSDTIYSVKATIHDNEGFPMDQQRLIYQRRNLEDGFTLADYNIRKDSNLDLILRIQVSCRCRF